MGCCIPYSVFRTPFHAAICERLGPCARVPRERSGLFCSLPLLYGSQCAAEEILKNWGRERAICRARGTKASGFRASSLPACTSYKVDLPGGSACLCFALCLPSAQSRRSNHDPSWGVQKFV